LNEIFGNVDDDGDMMEYDEEVPQKKAKKISSESPIENRDLGDDMF